jgi:hypothetical protein
LIQRSTADSGEKSGRHSSTIKPLHFLHVMVPLLAILPFDGGNLASTH